MFFIKCITEFSNWNNIFFIPISGLTGDGLIEHIKDHANWYQGPCLIECIDNLGKFSGKNNFGIEEEMQILNYVVFLSKINNIGNMFFYRFLRHLYIAINSIHNH